MFWYNVSKIILKNRRTWLTVILFTTAFMAFMASKITMSYELARILPKSDENYKIYEDFKQRFGEDGNVMVIAIETDKMYELNTFNAWYDLNKKIKSIEGIKNVLSNTKLFTVKKDDSLKKFLFPQIVPQKPTTQAEVDSIKSKIAQLPFYKGVIYSLDSKAHLMAVTFDQAKLNSKGRITISGEVQAAAEEFAHKTGIKVHFSGMPFIRTNFISKVSKEMTMFLGLAFLVTIGILYLFLRSFKTVLITQQNNNSNRPNY